MICSNIATFSNLCKLICGRLDNCFSAFLYKKKPFLGHCKQENLHFVKFGYKLFVVGKKFEKNCLMLVTSFVSGRNFSFMLVAF